MKDRIFALVAALVSFGSFLLSNLESVTGAKCGPITGIHAGIDDPPDRPDGPEGCSPAE